MEYSGNIKFDNIDKVCLRYNRQYYYMHLLSSKLATQQRAWNIR